MRGKPATPVGFDPTVRNIPAYAGKTETGCIMAVCVCGTSPRMRGKRFQYAELEYAQRNIPAYAGKTSTGDMK